MSRADTFLAGGLAVVVMIIFTPFAPIFMDPHHDGIMLKPALDVLSGQVLFRDSFSQYGPLTTYLQALALMVSPTLLSLRMLTVIAYAGSIGLLYLTWRAVLPRSLAFTGGTLFILIAAFYHPEWPMIPWSSTLALFFQSAAMLAFSRIVAGAKAAAWPWLLGVACACTFWCRQPVGIMLIGSASVIVGALYLSGWRHPEEKSSRIWLRAGLGIAAVSTLILGHLAIHGAAGAWWEQNILWPRRWAAGAGGDNFWVFVRFFLSQSSALVLVGVMAVVMGPALLQLRYKKIRWWVMPVWLVVCAAAYCVGGSSLRPSLLIETGGWRMVILAVLVMQSLFVIACAVIKKGAHDPGYYQVAALSGLVLASLAQVYPVACANHVFWALAPGFGLFVHFIYKGLRMAAWQLAVALLLLLCPALYEKYQWGKYNLNLPHVTLEQPPVLAGMKVPSDMAEAIANVQRVVGPVLAGNPDQKVMLYGDDAIYLTWFNNRENPTPYYVTWAGLSQPDILRARWEYLARERPVVLLNGPSAASLKAVPGDYRLVLHEPRLALRILLPAQVAPRLTEVQVAPSPAEPR